MSTTTTTRCSVRIHNYPGNAEIYISSDDTIHGQPVYAGHISVDFSSCTDEDGIDLEECEGCTYGFCKNKEYLCIGAMIDEIESATTVEEVEAILEDYCHSPMGIIGDYRA